MSGTPSTRRHPAVPVLVGAAILAVWLGWTAPQIRAGQDATDQADTATTQSVALRAEQARLTRARTQVDREAGAITRLRAAWPATADQQDLLTRLQGAATDTGVTIAGVTIGTPAPVGQAPTGASATGTGVIAGTTPTPAAPTASPAAGTSTGTAGTGQSRAPAGAARLARVDLTITATGPRPALERYTASLATLTRTVIVEKLALTPSSTAGEYSATLTVATYVMTAPPSAGPAPTAAPTGGSAR